MAEKKNSSNDENLGNLFLRTVIDSVPTVIDTVSKMMTTTKPTAESKPAVAQVKSEVQSADPTTNHSTSIKSPYAAWEGIGCTPKTAMFIEMSLVDGVIDTQERALIIKKASEEGVDMQELDFLIAKRLEANELRNKNAVKELSHLFREATKIAEKEIKADSDTLVSTVPQVMSLVGDCAKSNPAAAGILVSAEVLSVIGNFIKEPSKLNEFKAEIIRMIQIPMLPSVIVEFFDYASSQIIQEKQKNAGKGYFDICSEALFGKQLDLVPIWDSKIAQVMTKTVQRFGHDEIVMNSIEPYRITPLKKFVEIKDNNDAVLTFPVPTLAPDFIDLLRYVFKLSQDIRFKGGALGDAYYHLCQKMVNDGKHLANKFPKVASVIQECRLSPLSELKANIDNLDFLIMFNIPEDFDDAKEVLQYSSSKPQLKELHKRLYKQAEQKFREKPEDFEQLKQFKPKVIFGF